MATEIKYDCCLVGGTFDRLHSGHELLLSMAMSSSKSVEIYVVDDEIAKTKSSLIESFQTRVDNILDWLESKSYYNAKVLPLTDSFGPAPKHETADAIVGTPETIGNCEQINVLRKENGLQSLSIIEVPHILDYSGSIISSSRIRSGAIDTQGNPWIEDDLKQVSMKMTSKLDSELKTPMGQLFAGPEEIPEAAMSEVLESLPINHGSIVAVGDVSVKTLLDMSVVPDVGVIDGMTKREQLSASEQISGDKFDNMLNAINPPGYLTSSLISAIESALSYEDSSLIIVDGEEDLAPIIIHCLAPIGTIVLYGQPKQGVVVQITSLAVKQRCRNILCQFKVIT